MECPSCRSDAKTAEVGREHVYPDLLPGVPTFWNFMAPTLARAVTVAIGGIAVMFLLLGVASLAQGRLVVGISAGPVAVLSTYVFVRCLGALRHHRVKQQFRCGGCGLEWSPADERVR
jgi:hypothetical protein